MSTKWLLRIRVPPISGSAPNPACVSGSTWRQITGSAQTLQRGNHADFQVRYGEIRSPVRCGHGLSRAGGPVNVMAGMEHERQQSERFSLVARVARLLTTD